MKKHLFCAIILALGLLSGLMQVGNAQADPVIVQGQVMNGTQGGGQPEGLPVTLHVYSDESLSGTYTGETDLEGAFRFELMDLKDGDQLVVATSYLSISYTSPSYTYQTGQEVPEFSIVVYETTEENNHIVISQMTMMLNATEDELRVGEYYLLSNFGDRTWIGTFDAELGSNTTTQIMLPSDAESIWFNGGDLGDRFQMVTDGVADTAPVVPGAPSAEVFLTYAIPFDGEVDFTKSLNLPVESVGFLISEGSGITVEGDGIELSVSEDADNDFPISYLAPGFDSTEVLSFTVNNQQRSVSSVDWTLGLGLLSLFAAGLGIYWQLRKPQKATLPESADLLLRKIADLDEAFAAGAIEKDQYTEQRAALVEEIKILAKQI